MQFHAAVKRLENMGDHHAVGDHQAQGKVGRDMTTNWSGRESQASVFADSPLRGALCHLFNEPAGKLGDNARKHASKKRLSERSSSQTVRGGHRLLRCIS